MIQYGFDGVNVDWEYPGAGDRGGSEDDVHNFPLLLQMIRSRFKAASKDFGISITAPTSYWYLRWFGISIGISSGHQKRKGGTDADGKEGLGGRTC